ILHAKGHLAGFKGTIDLWPDFLIKANYAGVGLFYAALPCPAADTPLWFEAGTISAPSWPSGRGFHFVDYLRLSILRWGGFMGLDADWMGDDAPQGLSDPEWQPDSDT